MALSLEAHGYDVSVAINGDEALTMCSERPPDAVLLDLMLPDIDGLEVCKRLRRWFVGSIVVVTADGDERRKIAVLDEGADDYVTKPFSMPELHARVRVAVRRSRMLADHLEGPSLSAGALVIDTAGHSAHIGGEALSLTKGEFDLLALLVRNVDRVLSVDFLLERAWSGDVKGTVPTLRNRIAALRRALSAHPRAPDIVNEPGVGYRLTLR
ncbi:MAG: response regulator transcription factor [Acidimicrobiia bacterium]